MKLYGHPLSGNVHRAQALLEVLGVPYAYITVDLKAGEHKSPEFLALNPLGQVPVLVDGDVVLRDSIAIMTYVAGKHDPDGAWFPNDVAARAKVQEWLSTAVNDIQNGPFALRAIKLFGSKVAPALARARTEQLFGDLFEPRLARHDWLVGDRPSAADLACYGYVARVTEGEFDLAPYPAIRAWIARVEGIENFPPMVRMEELTASA